MKSNYVPNNIFYNSRSKENMFSEIKTKSIELTKLCDNNFKINNILNNNDSGLYMLQNKMDITNMEYWKKINPTLTESNIGDVNYIYNSLSEPGSSTKTYINISSNYNFLIGKVSTDPITFDYLIINMPNNSIIHIYNNVISTINDIDIRYDGNLLIYFHNINYSGTVTKNINYNSMSKILTVNYENSSI